MSSAGQINNQPNPVISRITQTQIQTDRPTHLLLEGRRGLSLCLQELQVFLNLALHQLNLLLLQLFREQLGPEHLALCLYPRDGKQEAAHYDLHHV